MGDTLLIESQPPETIYGCVNGCGPILIISIPGGTPWPGRGYRLGAWTIRNPSDLFVRPPGTQTEVLFPASPAALD